MGQAAERSNGAMPDAALVAAILAAAAHTEFRRRERFQRPRTPSPIRKATPVITLPRSRIQVVTGIYTQHLQQPTLHPPTRQDVLQQAREGLWRG